MGSKLRIGIFGGGGILGAHAAGLNAVRDRGEAEVVAVAEPSVEGAKRIRELLGPEVRIFPGYEALLPGIEVDAVDILLPHHLHLPATEAAARAGKHVLVEKVMARNIWECDRMLEACDETGVTLTVCHDRRYHGEWMALKKIVDSGVLGEVFLWRLDHNQDVAPPSGHWIRSREAVGGGAIMSCLIHQIDALRWYGGEVKSVACMTHARPERMEGEFAGTVLAHMKSGALAELSINWWTKSGSGENALWYERVQVCGTRGEAYYLNNRGTFIRLHDPSDRTAIARYGEAALKGFVKVESGNWPGHPRCIEEWVKNLRGEPSLVTTGGRECRGTVEVAEAAYLAEGSGRVVELPIEPRRWGEAEACSAATRAAGAKRETV